MTTVAEAQAAIRSRLETNFSALELRWKNETTPLPDEAVGFVFVELIVENAEYVGFGGGRFENLMRSTGRIEAQVAMPINTTVGDGVATGFGHAETIASLFRSYRDDTISCFAAEVFPGTGRTEDGLYDHCAVAIVDLHFDKIG